MDSAQFAKVASAAAQLEAAALDRGRIKFAFSGVADVLGGGMFQLINVTDPNAPELVVAPSLEGVQDDYIGSGWHVADTWTRTARAFARPGHLLQTELVDPDVQRRDPFFQEFCPRWNIGRFDAWAFALGEEMWGFTYMAAKNGPPGEGVHDMMKALMPAANRSALLASIMQDAIAEGIARGLEIAGRACFVLNHLGKVEHATPAAEALVGQGFLVKRAELSGLTPAADRHFRNLAQQARLSRPGALANFLIERLDGRRALLAMPIALRDHQLDGLPGARILVLLADLEPKGPIAGASRLQQMFRLTARESELALHLSTGASPEDAATRMSLTVATTRHMLKAIFAKTNTNRQSQLVALLARILA